MSLLVQFPLLSGTEQLEAGGLWCPSLGRCLWLVASGPLLLPPQGQAEKALAPAAEPGTGKTAGPGGERAEVGLPHSQD